MEAGREGVAVHGCEIKLGDFSGESVLCSDIVGGWLKINLQYSCRAQPKYPHLHI